MSARLFYSRVFFGVSILPLKLSFSSITWSNLVGRFVLFSTVRWRSGFALRGIAQVKHQTPAPFLSHDTTLRPHRQRRHDSIHFRSDSRRSNTVSHSFESNNSRVTFQPRRTSSSPSIPTILSVPIAVRGFRRSYNHFPTSRCSGSPEIKIHCGIIRGEFPSNLLRLRVQCHKRNLGLFMDCCVSRDILYSLPAPTFLARPFSHLILRQYSAL